MSVSAILPTGYQATASSTTGTSDLGKDQFMLLLLTQLRNQDPLQPMDNTEFISQLAQFNTLEQLQKMNDGLLSMMYMDQFAQASPLIGRTVEAVDQSTGETITGQVSEVSLEYGTAHLRIGDKLVPLENVIKVR